MNYKSLSGWVAPALEAWKGSGKQTYTWKNNRNQFWLGFIIVLLLIIGWNGNQYYANQIKDLKKEVKTLNTKQNDDTMEIKRLNYEMNALLSVNKDTVKQMQLLDDSNRALMSELSVCRLKVKETQLEKLNVENLLVASSQHARDLKEKLSQVLKYSDLEKRNEELLRSYNELNL